MKDLSPPLPTPGALYELEYSVPIYETNMEKYVYAKDTFVLPAGSVVMVLEQCPNEVFWKVLWDKRMCTVHAIHLTKKAV